MQTCLKISVQKHVKKDAQTIYVLSLFQQNILTFVSSFLPIQAEKQAPGLDRRREGI